MSILRLISLRCVEETTAEKPVEPDKKTFQGLMSMLIVIYVLDLRW